MIAKRKPLVLVDEELAEELAELGAIADERAAEGIAKAEKGAGSAWRAEAAEALEAYLLVHEFYAADDFWLWANKHYGLGPGPSPRALGGIVQAAGNRGLMLKTTMACPSTRSNNAPGWIWISEIYQGVRTHRWEGPYYNECDE